MEYHDVIAIGEKFHAWAIVDASLDDATTRISQLDTVPTWNTMHGQGPTLTQAQTAGGFKGRGQVEVLRAVFAWSTDLTTFDLYLYGALQGQTLFNYNVTTYGGGVGGVVVNLFWPLFSFDAVSNGLDIGTLTICCRLLSLNKGAV